MSKKPPSPPPRQIFVGYDPREAVGFRVAVRSISALLKSQIRIRWVELTNLQKKGLYTRPMEFIGERKNILFDTISHHPMSTEFALTRFLVPHLAETGWALFVDGDVMARADLTELFDLADPKYAVMCVKHQYEPVNFSKMEGQTQSVYPRKNWSSVVLFNCYHPSNKKLTVTLVNTAKGKNLHNFCWLKDEEIGEFPEEWNYLVGHSKLPSGKEVKLVHFTEGLPNMKGYEYSEFAQEWRDWQ